MTEGEASRRPGVRRESREKVFQTLFMMDAQGVGPEEAISLFLLVQEPPADRAYYEATVRGVWDRRREIDRLIRSAAENWRLERMAVVDRNILRLGAYEIRCAEEIPDAVAINEAVDLAKRFGSEESGAFVNGLLDRIARMKTTSEEGA